MNRKRYLYSQVIAFILIASFFQEVNAEIHVPASTAYVHPDVRGARVSPRSGITRWNDPKLMVLWFGRINSPGKLKCSVNLYLDRGEKSKLRLTINKQAHETNVIGLGNDKLVTADFGSYDLKKAGYIRFELESLNEVGESVGRINELVLDGPAIQDAHFNLKPRRNAASVHLMYPVPKETNIAAFYCEVTAATSPIWSFYMACGWHRGYFGMQVNSPQERRIIFSVWDSGGEPKDRDKVNEENRVKLIAKGKGVHTNDFGNEGTGGHSHLVFPWKTGEKQRFIVTAEPEDATHTIYTGFYFLRDKKKWMLISSWRAPKEGGYLRRPHSFSENFVGSNGHLVRQAFYGNQWIRDDKGNWTELTTAKFSHDRTGRSDRLDRYMSVEKGRFLLSHGGFISGFTKYGEAFNRPALETAPTDLVLPKISPIVQSK